MKLADPNLISEVSQESSFKAHFEQQISNGRQLLVRHSRAAKQFDSRRLHQVKYYQ
jgi:hypothetical protein